MTTTDAVRISERYGAGRRRGPRVLLILLLVAAAVLVVWFGWTLWMTLTPKVDSGLETWHATGENSVSVTYVVRLHKSGIVATCSADAQDADSQIVGSHTFKATDGRHTVTFPTDREAARVVWNKCTAPGQDDPR